MLEISVKKYQQHFFTRGDFLCKVGSTFKILISQKNIYQQWNGNILIYHWQMTRPFVVLCKDSEPSRQKRKICGEKFVLAQCACIYLMTLSWLWSKFLGENRASCEGRRGKPYFVYLSFRIHFHILAGPFFDQFWLYIKISNKYIQTDINKNRRAAFLQ